MIRAIIFDCFGVLCVDSSEYFYQTNLDNYHELREQLLDLNRQYDRGWATLAQHAAAVAELTGLDAQMVRENIHAKIERNEQLIELSQQLRREYKVGLLSNIGVGGMERFFSATEREELFDATVLSGDVGIVKPDPEVYLLMAERLGVPPEECLMIDDSLANCAGAEAAGMQAMHFTSNQEVRDRFLRS